MEKEIISGIYKITNKINGKNYIGKSENIFERWKQHKRELNNMEHVNKNLLKDWIRFEEKSFEFEILEQCDKNLFERESYYIEKYQSRDIEKGYNIAISYSNKTKEIIKKGKITSEDLLKELHYKDKRSNLILTENIIKIYNDEIIKYIQNNNIELNDISFLYELCPFIQKNTNILCDKNGYCLHQKYLCQQLKISKKTIIDKLKPLLKYNFIKEISIGRENYYIVNPKFIHSGFYVYEEIINLFSLKFIGGIQHDKSYT